MIKRIFSFAKIRAFAKNESGATAIEYGLIAALISIAAIGAFQAVGDSLNDFFDAVSDTLDDNQPGGGE